MSKQGKKSTTEKIPDICSVHEIAVDALAVVRTTTGVFAEDKDINPIPIDDRYSIMPWGFDNQMPYDILEKIQADETVSTCLNFNSELMYGGSLQYQKKVNGKIDEACEDPESLAYFKEYNTSLSQEFLGSCVDLKHWGFCVNVIILNHDGTYISTIERREAINCRFEVADSHGVIKNIFYGNWRKYWNADNVERLPLLNIKHPLKNLKERLANGDNTRKFAILSIVPTANRYYYPIPQYACIFKSKWYDIKSLVAISKQAKLENSAPIKYHVEISKNYFRNLFDDLGITDPVEMVKLQNKKKKEILDYLTGAHNSGKCYFSTYYVDPNGREEHDIIIKPIDTGKEGGDWEQDFMEAVNTICFAMGVHSNLVGSVPGKAQTNNSGSDKRELYTIAQLRQRAYHDVLLASHEVVCRFNGWKDFHPVVPLLMLTTLDEHTDVKPLNPDNNGSDK